MLTFAYDSIDYSADRSRVRVRPNCPAAPKRFMVDWLLRNCLLQPDRLGFERTETLLRGGRPFVYPLEMTGEMHRRFAEGPPGFAPDMPAPVLAAVRAGRASLLIWIGHEPMRNEFDDAGERTIFDLIQSVIREHDLPPSRVWFVSGNVLALGSFAVWMNARRLYEPEVFQLRTLMVIPSMVRATYRANERGWDLSFNFDFADYGFEAWTVPFAADAFAERYVRVEEVLAERDGGRIRDKRFLCMNNHQWLHRQVLVSYLQARGFVENSLVSFSEAPPDLNNFCSFPAPPHSSIQETVRQGWLALQPKLPLTIDIGSPLASHLAPDQSGGSNTFRVASGWPYRRSYFNIVSESTFDHNPLISEKLMKPIVNLQPFVCVASPDSLRYLRAIGFQTFSRVFDEGYDKPGNYLARILAVFSQIDLLGGLSDAEAREVYFECLPEMQHNRTHLIESRHELDRLFDDLEAQLG